MTKTQTQTTTAPVSKSSKLFGLSGKQLKLVVGGTGVIGDAPAPKP